MMDSGRDPREGIFLCLELILNWLLAVGELNSGILMATSTYFSQKNLF